MPIDIVIETPPAIDLTLKESQLDISEKPLTKVCIDSLQNVDLKTLENDECVAQIS